MDPVRVVSRVRERDRTGRAVSDNKTHWVAKVMGVSREFDAEITEQHPDEWISWKTEGGLVHAGDVIFKDAAAGEGTLVAVQIEYEPQDIVEKVGDEAGLVLLRMQSALKDFKKFIESHDDAQGEWRGEIGDPLAEMAASSEETSSEETSSEETSSTDSEDHEETG
jgi:hypothetical protein